MTKKEIFIVQISKIFSDFRINESSENQSLHYMRVYIRHELITREELKACFEIGSFSIHRELKEFILYFDIPKK